MEQTRSVLQEKEKKEVVRELINDYVMVVDDTGRVEEWPNFFTEDGAYYVYTRENYERGLPMAVVLDDNKGRILDRVRTIRDIWAGHYEEQIPRHTISVPHVSFIDEKHAETITNFTVTIMKTDQQVYTFVGRYLDKIGLQDDGTAKFVEKKVILDNAVLPTYVVYPL